MRGSSCQLCSRGFCWTLVIMSSWRSFAKHRNRLSCKGLAGMGRRDWEGQRPGLANVPSPVNAAVAGDTLYPQRSAHGWPKPLMSLVSEHSMPAAGDASGGHSRLPAEARPCLGSEGRLPHPQRRALSPL